MEPASLQFSAKKQQHPFQPTYIYNPFYDLRKYLKLLPVLCVLHSRQVLSVYSDKNSKAPLGGAGDVHFLRTSPGEGLARHLEAVDGGTPEVGRVEDDACYIVGLHLYPSVFEASVLP